MAGRIIPRGKKFRIQIYLGRSPTGKREYHYETCATRSEAEARLVEYNETQSVIDKVDLTVDRLLEQWISEHVTVECEPRTLESYLAQGARITPRIGHFLASSITPARLLSMYAGLRTCGGASGQPLSHTSVRHVHRALSAAYNHAVALGRLQVNPCQQLPRNKRPKSSTSRATALTQEQLQEQMEGFEVSALFPLLTLAASTGLRRGELCGLKWGDLDLDRHLLTVNRTVEQCRGHELRLKVPKTPGSERTIRLAPTILPMLREEKKRVAELALAHGVELTDAAVFPSRDLWHRSPNGLSKEIHRWQKSRGMPRVGLHTLRHTHATWLLAARLSPKAVAERLGHSDVATTLRVYDHAMKEKEDDLIDVIESGFKSA